jgi:predicted AlkP superfamily pyrophosphatase or phosphodiesterase
MIQICQIPRAAQKSALLSVFFAFCLVFVGCAGHPTSPSSHPYVILISIDGYRYDYTERVHPPHLEALAREGLQAASLQPIFPSKTFPNHFSIITGLYAAHHGLVSNEFYDPDRRETYKLGDNRAVSDGSWYSGVPLWNLAESQGLKSGCAFWPGSEAAIGGRRPSYFMKYDVKVTNEARVDQVLQWLRLPEDQRPHFLTLYFSAVDSAGHHEGPASDAIRTSIGQVDSAIARLQDGLKELHLPVNLIVVSDHGMQEIDRTKTEYVDDYAPLDGFTVLGDGTHALLYLNDGQKPQKIAETLHLLQNSKHQFRAYAPDQTPSDWHYRDNKRLGAIVLSEVAPSYMLFHSKAPRIPAGNHGYDPTTTATMRGIFYAKGPNIRSGHVATFENIHIYPFIAKILNLSVKDTIDGRLDVLGPYAN